LPAPLAVGVLLYDDVQPLDVAGPIDVLSAASQQLGDGRGYAIHTIGIGGAPVRAENGLRLQPDTSLDAAPALDTLIVPGGRGARLTLSRDARVAAWLRARSTETRRMVSICTGVFAFAGAGLLDGRRATTHWRYGDELQQRFPRVKLDIDSLYLRDGRFHSSGGLTAGMDLALSLVSADFGAEVALAVARELVMYMHRPGSQAQFSAPLDAQTRGTRGLKSLVDWMLAHLREDLSVQRLAQQAGMSERNFRRVFNETFAMSPAKFVARLRLERACMLLSTGRGSVEAIARSCGFAHADVFRRAFAARYGTAPRDYRERFRAR
jgi:transcriptional regulator GlxA family with amidase domain